MKKKVIIAIIVAVSVLVVAAAVTIALVTYFNTREEAPAQFNIIDLLNKEAVFDEAPLILESGKEVSTLEKTKVIDRGYDLVYFKEPASSGMPEYTIDPETGDLIEVVDENASEFERHVVYNVENGKTLFNVTESDKTEIEVTLDYVNDGEFFTVTTTRYNLDKDKIRTNVSKIETELYDCKGDKVASVKGVATATTVEDVVYFNGQCYRAQDDGTIAYAFDYSLLSAFPEDINEKANGKYYAIDRENDKGIKVYDDKFAFLYEVEVPSYVDLGPVIFLNEEKLLIQYSWELDEDATEFDLTYVEETEGVVKLSKQNLVTFIYNPADGTSTEIDCPYAFADSLFDYSYYAYEKDYDEVNTENTQAILFAFEIVDGYLRVEGEGAGITVGINAENQFFTVEEINGEPIVYFCQTREGQWSVYTLNYEYLMDNEGNILGEISNSYYNYDLYYTMEYMYDNADNYLGTNYPGMIYDSNLALNYNASSKEMQIVDVLEGTFLLENFDGEVFCYNGSSAKKIISKSRAEKCEYEVLDSSLVCVIDSSKEDDINVEFYNAEGKKIFETDFEAISSMDDTVIATENSVLVPYTNADGNQAYYRFK